MVESVLEATLISADGVEVDLNAKTLDALDGFGDLDKCHLLFPRRRPLMEDGLQVLLVGVLEASRARECIRTGSSTTTCCEVGLAQPVDGW